VYAVVRAFEIIGQQIKFRRKLKPYILLLNGG
jgi:hypothetical protein